MNCRIIGLGLVIPFWIVGCGASISPLSSASTALATSAAAAVPTDSPTATPSSLQGPVGTSFSDTDAQGNVMSLTLVKVMDPAQGADIYTTPDNGKRFVGVQFKITGTSGAFSSDVNNDASLVGSDSQTYTADFSNIAGCTNFNSGMYSVTAGTTSVGCAVFQVPTSVKVAHIQWGGGYGSTPAVWDTAS